MSLRAITAALDFMPDGVRPRDRLVALALADHVNDADGFAWPSVATIARRTGLSRRSVFRSLDDLEAAGVVTRVERYRDGRRTTTGYQWHLWVTLPQAGDNAPCTAPRGVTLARGGVSR